MSASTSGASEWCDWVTESVERLHTANLLRTLRPLVPRGQATQAGVHAADLAAWIDGVAAPCSLSGLGANPNPSPGVASELRGLRLFGTNDYLGLSVHPDVCRAAAAAAMQAGMGPRSSALVCGFTQAHRDLEDELARLKGTEDCLLFPTGFAANVATVAALCGAPGVHVFSDELNHASIIDGARLAARAGAAVHVYRHNDMAHLEQLLRGCPPGARKLVVTDSLFSMDGDYADLAALARLRGRHGFLLALDEAHATLVAGEHAGGAAEQFGVAGQVDVHIGTLSKAFGCLGGFVACSSRLRALLLNRGRSVLYSTALPLPVVAGALAALRAGVREGWRRRHLAALAARVGGALGVPACSPIIPLVVGSEAEALRLSSELLRRGFHVPAIRPPTVPPGTARLRLSLSAAHSLADVDDLCAALQALGATFAPLERAQRAASKL